MHQLCNLEFCLIQALFQIVADMSYHDSMKRLSRILKIIASVLIAFVVATAAINAYCILGTRAQMRTILQIEAQLKVVDVAKVAVGGVKDAFKILASTGVDVEGILSNITGETITIDSASDVAVEVLDKSTVPADSIVVLGASVYGDGTPSDILADRLEVAADLYKAGAASNIIASGDNRTDHYNESDSMKSYLVKLGVPEDAITVDPQGYDTYSSIYRARFEYGAEKMIVVSQAYHLYRALMISNLLGANSLGVAADKGEYDNQAQYSIRDVLARDKDFVISLLKLPPTQ